MGNKRNRSRMRQAKRHGDTTKALAQLALNRETRHAEMDNSLEIAKSKSEAPKAVETQREVPLKLQAKAANLRVGRLRAALAKQSELQNKLKCFKGRHRARAGIDNPSMAVLPVDGPPQVPKDHCVSSTLMSPPQQTVNAVDPDANRPPKLSPKPRKRPTSLSIRSHTKDAARKRQKRDEEKLAVLDPELAARVRLVPISDDIPQETPQFSIAKSIRIRRRLRLSRRRYREARLFFKELVPEAQCEQGRALLYAEAGFADIDLPGIQGVWRSLENTLLGLVENADLEKLPKPLRVTLAFDGRSDGKVKSTKFILHLADSDKPASCFTSAIYAVVLGDETYINLAPILDRLDDEIDAVQTEGVEIDGELYEMSFFVVADCKGTCLACGLQGGNSTYGCPWCLVHRQQMNAFKQKNPATERTIESMKLNAEEYLKEAYGPLPKGKDRAHLHQSYFSVNTRPLLPSIPMSRVVPPVLHITMSLVNEVFGNYKELYKQSALNLLKSAGAVIQKGRDDDLTGSDGAKLVRYVAKLPARRRKGKHLACLAATKRILQFTSIDSDVSNIGKVIPPVIRAFKKIRTVQNKVHALEAHVASFCEAHGSWARFSEQGVESLHKYLNQTRVNMYGRPAINIVRCFVKEMLAESIVAS